jgi:hypothetical protein
MQRRAKQEGYEGRLVLEVFSVDSFVQANYKEGASCYGKISSMLAMQTHAVAPSG